MAQEGHAELSKGALLSELIAQNVYFRKKRNLICSGSQLILEHQIGFKTFTNTLLFAIKSSYWRVYNDLRPESRKFKVKVYKKRDNRYKLKKAEAQPLERSLYMERHRAASAKKRKASSNRKVTLLLDVPKQAQARERSTSFRQKPKTYRDRHEKPRSKSTTAKKKPAPRAMRNKPRVASSRKVKKAKRQPQVTTYAMREAKRRQTRKTLKKIKNSKSEANFKTNEVRDKAGAWKAMTAKHSVSIRSNRAIGNGLESEEANFASNGGVNGEIFNDFIEQNVENLRSRNMVIRAKLYGNLKKHSRPIYSRPEAGAESRGRNPSKSEKKVPITKPTPNCKSEIRIVTGKRSRPKRDPLESVGDSIVSEKHESHVDKQVQMASMRPVHNCEFLESNKAILNESGQGAQKGDIGFLLEKPEESASGKKGESVVTELSGFEGASLKKSILLQTVEIESVVINQETNLVESLLVEGNKVFAKKTGERGGDKGAEKKGNEEGKGRKGKEQEEQTREKEEIKDGQGKGQEEARNEEDKQEENKKKGQKIPEGEPEQDKPIQTDKEVIIRDMMEDDKEKGDKTEEKEKKTPKKNKVAEKKEATRNAIGTENESQPAKPSKARLPKKAFQPKEKFKSVARNFNIQMKWKKNASLMKKKRKYQTEDRGKSQRPKNRRNAAKRRSGTKKNKKPKRAKSKEARRKRTKPNSRNKPKKEEKKVTVTKLIEEQSQERRKVVVDETRQTEHDQEIVITKTVTEETKNNRKVVVVKTTTKKVQTTGQPAAESKARPARKGKKSRRKKTLTVKKKTVDCKKAQEAVGDVKLKEFNAKEVDLTDTILSPMNLKNEPLRFQFLKKSIKEPKPLNLSLSPGNSIVMLTNNHPKKKPLQMPAVVLNNEEKQQLSELTGKAKTAGKAISAASFIVFECTQNKVLLSRGLKIRREIASLTKIMTCFTALRFARRHNLDLKTTLFEISKKAQKTRGTSARLKYKHYMSFEDLLYGLMLPSGNDAALVLAENIGRLLRLKKGKNLNRKLLNYKECPRPDSHFFIDLMNETRKGLKMKNSFFMNPHGLNNPRNFSTCQDMIHICSRALEMQKFSEVIQCREFTGRLLKRVIREEYKQQMIARGENISVEISSTSSSNKTLENSRTFSRNQSISYQQGTLAGAENSDLSKFSTFVTSNISNSIPPEKVKRVRFSTRIANKSYKKFYRNPIAGQVNPGLKSSLKKNSKYQTLEDKPEEQAPVSQRGKDYLLNKKKRVEKKITRFNNVKSKRDFYDRIKNMFIMRMGNQEDEDARLRKERKQILKRKLYNPAKHKKAPQTHRPSRFSNKNLIYSNMFHHSSSTSQLKVPGSLRDQQRSPVRLYSVSKGGPHRTPRDNVRKGSVPKSKLDKLISLDRRGDESLKVSEVSGKQGQKTAQENVASETRRLRMQKSSRSRKKKKVVRKEIQLEAHMKNLKELWGKSIGEIQEVLMERNKFNYVEAGEELWKNSNLLLKNEKYFGIKTGNTSNAKFCLASYKRESDFEYLASKSPLWLILSFAALLDQRKAFFGN